MSQHLYRIDKFTVPPAAKTQFLEAVRNIELLLRTLPGCVRAVTYEQTGGPGVFNVVTIAEWESAEAMGNAKEVSAARYKETGFDPAQFMARLGIQADMAVYAEKANEP